MSMLDLRVKPYTMDEFNALGRYPNGDLSSMFDHFLLLTPEQVELLTEDDKPRYREYREELQHELSLLVG